VFPRALVQRTTSGNVLGDETTMAKATIVH
jgi:hypothetical protein